MFVEINGGNSLISDKFISYERWKIYLRKLLYRRDKRQLEFKVKSCNSLSRVLLICIIIYLKSVMRHAYLILDIYHPDTLYLHDHGCDDSWSFFEAIGGLRSNEVWEILSEVSSEYKKWMNNAGQETNLGKSEKQVIIK
jgi:hypothetical protein